MTPRVCPRMTRKSAGLCRSIAQHFFKAIEGNIEGNHSTVHRSTHPTFGKVCVVVKVCQNGFSFRLAGVDTLGKRFFREHRFDESAPIGF